jgi:hypothetical protein
MKNAVLYRGQWLARNSRAFELFEAKNYKALDQHLKEVHQKAVQRGEIR